MYIYICIYMLKSSERFRVLNAFDYVSSHFQE